MNPAHRPASQETLPESGTLKMLLSVFLVL